MILRSLIYSACVVGILALLLWAWNEQERFECVREKLQRIEFAHENPRILDLFRVATPEWFHEQCAAQGIVL